MKTFVRTVAMVAVVAAGLSAKPAQAQVSLGIATPGFALGVGPGAGFVGVGGAYPAYPAVIAPPLIVPRPVVVAPPFYGRPYYGGYPHAYGYGRPGYGPRYAYPAHRYR